MIIKVEQKQLLAAQLFRAYQDARYYLNGLFFDKNGTLASTDGHRLFIGKHDNNMDESVIVSIKNKTPNKFDFAEIDTKNKLIYYKSDEGESLFVDLIDIINGKFPDYEKILTQTKYTSEHASKIGFNSEYLSDILKAGKILNPKYPSIKISFPQHNDQPALFEFSTSDARVILMPMRL